MIIDKIKKRSSLGETKRYILPSSVIFLLSFFVGVFFFYLYPDTAEKYLQELIDTFSPILESLGPVEMGIFLFVNNSVKMLIFIFLGTLFAIPTIFFLGVNGFVLGYVSFFIYLSFGFVNLFNSLFYHGIFEISALIIGSAAGIRLGFISFSKIKDSRKERSLKSLIMLDKEVFKEVFGIYLYLVLPLLLIAAIIETYLIFYL